jgi:D-alanyl-D-alanine carboxypeptidase
MNLRRRGPLVAAFAAALLATTTAVAHHARADAAAAPGAGLHRILDRWRDRADLPAVTMAVDVPGRPLLAAAGGTAERGGGTPVAVDAPFRVASITKLFVATVVLQLAEEGRLRLDDPLARHVTGYPRGDRITIRHLLTHTSGVPDYGLTPGFGRRLLADRERRWHTDEVLALVAGVRPDFPPGAGYRYSNTGYLLLGKVIDAVTGSTWAAEIRRRVIDPLGLRHTFIAGTGPVPGGVLPGYFDADNDGDRENVETGRPWPSLETTEGPAGAIVSTAPDLAAFGRALFRGHLVRPETLRQMVTEGPHHPRNSNYGLGVEISRPDYRTTLWGHGGFVPGFRSVLWYAPRHDVTVVVLVNDAQANPQDLAELALRTAVRPR